MSGCLKQILGGFLVFILIVVHPKVIPQRVLAIGFRNEVAIEMVVFRSKHIAVDFICHQCLIQITTICQSLLKYLRPTYHVSFTQRINTFRQVKCFFKTIGLFQLLSLSDFGCVGDNDVESIRKGFLVHGLECLPAHDDCVGVGAVGCYFFENFHVVGKFPGECVVFADASFDGSSEYQIEGNQARSHVIIQRSNYNQSIIRNCLS